VTPPIKCVASSSGSQFERVSLTASTAEGPTVYGVTVCSIAHSSRARRLQRLRQQLVNMEDFHAAAREFFDELIVLTLRVLDSIARFVVERTG